MRHPLHNVVTSTARGLLAYARTGAGYDALNEKVVASAGGLGVSSGWIWRRINELAAEG
jgi:hypothetical protein